MLAVVETIGIWAPLVALGLLVIYRGRAPQGVRWGGSGCVLACLASLVGLIGSRAMFFGGGGAEGIFERSEWWGAVRLALLLVAVGCLVRGALLGRTDRTRPTGQVGGGVALVLLGLAVRLIPVRLGDGHDGLAFLVSLAVDAAQFGLIGLGVILLSLGVISSRGVRDGRDEPAVLLRRGMAKAWEIYRGRPRDIR